MRGFCHHVPMVLPRICEQFPKLAPGMPFYIERFQFWLLLSLDLLLTACCFKDFKARLFSFHGCCHVACFWRNRIAEVQYCLSAAHFMLQNTSQQGHYKKITSSWGTSKTKRNRKEISALENRLPSLSLSEKD